MRPDKTKPCRADHTRKQQAGSELIQTNQTKAYQDQSGTDQTDWATPHHRDQTELNGALFTSNSRHTSNGIRLQRMTRPRRPNSQKQRRTVGESTQNHEVDNPHHLTKTVSKPSKRRNLSNNKHVKNHDKLNTTPTQKHIQKDGSKNAMSTKTCQNLEASTSNT